MTTFNFEPLTYNPKDLAGFAAANGLTYSTHQPNQPYPALKGSLFNASYNSRDYKVVMRHDRLAGTYNGTPFEVGAFDFRNHTSHAFRLRFAFSYLRVTLPASLPRMGIDSRGSTFEVAKAFAMKKFPWYPAAQLPLGLQAKYDPDYQQVINEAMPSHLLTFLSSAGKPFSVEIIDNELYVYMYASLQPQVVHTLFEALQHIDLRQLADLDERITRTDQTPYTTDEALSRFVPLRKGYAGRIIWWRVGLPISIVVLLAIAMFLL